MDQPAHFDIFLQNARYTIVQDRLAKITHWDGSDALIEEDKMYSIANFIQNFGRNQIDFKKQPISPETEEHCLQYFVHTVESGAFSKVADIEAVVFSYPENQEIQALKQYIDSNNQESSSEEEDGVQREKPETTGRSSENQNQAFQCY